MSEFALIERYFKQLTAAHTPSFKGDIGIGDDAAVLSIPPDHQLVSCVDTLIAGRHFPHGTTPHAIGWKSVAVNLSDLAAMGATAQSILLALSLPSVDEPWLAEFCRGLADCCREFGVRLIGGDTTRSSVLTISITALGIVPHGRALTRSGAQVGDKLCVSGNIGSAAYALAQVLTGQSTSLQTALDYPQPQLALGAQLRDYASSAIDISDGLGQDLGHILAASQVGAHVDVDKIPAATALHSLSDAQKWHYQLNGGDDYQLCFTLSPAHFAVLQPRYPDQIFAIGEIVSTPGLVLFNQQQPIDFAIKGWQHF